MNSITNYTKKREILARRELSLRRLISRSARAEELLIAAAEVRDARVRVLRAIRATVIPKDDAHLHYAQIDKTIDVIRAMSPVEILAECGVSIGDPNLPDDTI